MWTIIIAVCYAPMFQALPPRCQQLTETKVTYHMTEEECMATSEHHQEQLAQELARQGLRMVQFGTKCVQSGDPA